MRKEIIIQFLKKNIVWIIYIFSFAIVAFYLISKGHQIAGDSGKYINLNPQRPPGYPLFLSFFKIFGDNNFFPVDVLVEEESEIFYIEKKELLCLLQKDKRVLENILDSFSNKTQFLSKRLNFSNKSIEEKLAIYILENTENNIFRINTSITNLAEIFGVSRPSLSRVIINWTEDKILYRIDSKNFKVLKIDELEDKLV